MRTIYRRWMEDWENSLCFKTNNRVVRPFEWGIDFANEWPVTKHHPRNGHDPEGWLRELNGTAIRNSDDFFGYEPPTDFQLEGDMLNSSRAMSSLRFFSANRTGVLPS